MNIAVSTTTGTVNIKKKHTVGLISALVSPQEVSISQEVRVNTILSEGCIQDRYQKVRCCLDHN